MPHVLNVPPRSPLLHFTQQSYYKLHKLNPQYTSAMASGTTYSLSNKSRKNNGHKQTVGVQKWGNVYYYFKNVGFFRFVLSVGRDLLYKIGSPKVVLEVYTFKSLKIENC